ncbi:MAG: signal peptidase I [Neomegalonema sp.]|nr:signal peptidase I [Neomegalonema sp.]
MSTEAETATEKPKETVWDLILTIFYALLIALTFRTVLFQPFSIPSGSMKSTLLIGDYIFVSKYAYGYSKHALPFGRMLPIEGRLFGAQPERGDVVVFALPDNPQVDYIKRVIGLPGDRIQVIKGVLQINGEPVQLTSAGDFVEPFAPQGPDQKEPACKRRQDGLCFKEKWLETLPNGLQHTILNIDSNLGRSDNSPVYVVPEGHYFFMGDNRDNSQDSRWRHVGFVPEENLIGRAERVLFSSAGAYLEIWNWRSDRFLKSIQ